MGNANPANTTFLRWLSLLIISLLSLPADAQSGNGDYDTYTTWSEFVTEYLEQNIDEDALEVEYDLRQDLQFMEDLHLRRKRRYSPSCVHDRGAGRLHFVL